MTPADTLTLTALAAVTAAWLVLIAWVAVHAGPLAWTATGTVYATVVVAGATREAWADWTARRAHRTTTVGGRS